MKLNSIGWTNGACSEDGLDETNKSKDRGRKRRKLLHVVEGGWRGLRLSISLHLSSDISTSL